MPAARSGSGLGTALGTAAALIGGGVESAIGVAREHPVKTKEHPVKKSAASDADSLLNNGLRSRQRLLDCLAQLPNTQRVHGAVVIPSNDIEIRQA